MIDLSNLHQSLSIQDRKEILNRALHSQNFFTQLDFAIGDDQAYYSAKDHVDKDFYLTQIASTFSEQGAENIDMKVYIGNKGGNIFSYLPTGTTFEAEIRGGFQCYTPNTNSAGNTGQFLYCPKQREIFPYFVKRNDTLNAQLSFAADTDQSVLLGGYYPLGRAHMSQTVTRGVNESLDNDSYTELWHFDLDGLSQITKSFVNDRFARVVLGFGSYIPVADGDTPAYSTVLIEDVLRGIRFSQQPLNMQLIAPRTGAHGSFSPAGGQLNTNIYFLPIEHFWQPFAPLKFNCKWTANDSPYIRFYMLTRTV